MTLLNAPEYNEGKEKRKVALLVGSSSTLLLLIILTLAGFMLGHGWLFTNLPAEHRVDTFLTALEAKDYPKAYGILQNDPNWAQHPDKYKDYPLARFTDDWTTDPDLYAPITSHHVDISKTDGSGNFGTGIIVAVRVNGSHKLFIWYQKSDGTLSASAPHELQY